jgi:hypothetical protein
MAVKPKPSVPDGATRIKNEMGSHVDSSSATRKPTLEVGVSS